MKISRMMKWKTLLILFPVATWSFSFIGKWKPENLANIIIHAKETHVIGIVSENKSIIKMEIKEYDKKKIVLNNINVVKKPFDWLNLAKYKDYIGIFNKIQNEGLVCEFDFLDENNLIINPQIGEENYKFILNRLDEKNDF